MAGLTILLTQITKKRLQQDLPAIWVDIKTAFKSQQIPQFNNSQIVEYFVTRTVSDGLHSDDFKSINKSVNPFHCGHV